jgi:hypothetical protein
MQVSRDAGSNGELVSLAKLKDLARRLLPPNSATRSVILAAKDVLPAREAFAKFEVYDRLLSKELGLS